MTTDITRAIEASGAREAFARDGVAYLPGVLPEPFLGQLLEAWQWSMANPGPLASPLVAGRKDGRQDLCNPGALPVYRDVLLQSPVADLTAALWGVPDVWFMYEQVFHKVAGAAVGTPWHQDTSYLRMRGDELVAVWTCLDPLPKDYCLEFVRGSHRGELFNGSAFDARDDTAPLYKRSPLQRLPDIQADRAAYDILSWDVTPGDLIVFHLGVLHGGAGTAPGMRRRTVSLRFLGPDVVFDGRMRDYRDAQEGNDVALAGFYAGMKDGDPFRVSLLPPV